MGESSLSLRKYDADGRQRLSEFLAFCKNPQKSYPSIFVTGTNGKGSVCAMLEAILLKAGYRVGLYTNPSIVDEEEMYRVNGKTIRLPQMDALRESISKKIERFSKKDYAILHTDYFFLKAVWFFAQEKVDIVIHEANGGAYWDPGYNLDPMVSVITSIGEDHFDLFGDSLDAVAYEKSGAIRENMPLVLGKIPAAQKQLLLDIAEEKNAPVFSVEEHFGPKIENYPQTVLKGEYQRINAAIAQLTLSALAKEFPVTEDDMNYGLQNVYWPARWQAFPIDNDRTLIFDFAHNPEGLRAIEPQLKALVEKKGKCIFFLSMFFEYRAEFMVPFLAKYAKEFVYFQSNKPDFITFEKFKTYLPKNFKGQVTQTSLQEAFPGIHSCMLGSKGDAVVVLGSPAGIICPAARRFFLSISDMKSLEGRTLL